MVISIDVKKALDKIQNIFVFSELGIEGNFFNLIKDFYQKKKKKTQKTKKTPPLLPPQTLQLTSYLMVKTTKKQKGFSLTSGKRQGFSFILLRFNIILKVLANAIGQEKEIR